MPVCSCRNWEVAGPFHAPPPSPRWCRATDTGAATLRHRAQQRQELQPPPTSWCRTVFVLYSLRENKSKRQSKFWEG